MDYRYRYLHIGPPSTRMMKGFIKMLNEHFNISEHYYLCKMTTDGADGFTALCPNIINFKDLGKGKIRKLFSIVKMLKESKNIVVHGFTFQIKWLILLYLCREQLAKKGIWVIWGVDLYNYHRTTGNKLINALINHMEDKVREACRTSVAVFPTDVAVFKRIFGDQKTIFCSMLGFTQSSFDQWDALLEERAEKEKKYLNAFELDRKRISIQVGHNAFPFNEHGSSLTMLQTYREHNLLITMPVSYGNDYGDQNKNYVEDLKHLAYNLFPVEKIRFLTNIMPLHKYYEFLAAVDVAILPAPRQNALGNIIPLMYMGKKVFLSQENPLFNFFKSKGFEIYNVKDIAHMSYEEFVTPIKSSYPNPWIKNCYSLESNVKRWKVVFGYSDGQYSLEEAYSMMEGFDFEEEETTRRYIEENEERKRIEEANVLEKEMTERRQQELLQIYNWLAEREREDQELREKDVARQKKWQEQLNAYRIEEEQRKEAERLAAENNVVVQETADSQTKHDNVVTLRARAEVYEKKQTGNGNNKDKYVLVIERVQE